jgi:protein-S-isoprenylcysteine O-methyltransferase Ste14
MARAALGSFVFLFVGPGVVVGLVPWLLTAWNAEPEWVGVRIVGWVLIVGGATVVLYSFARFATEGLGTPLPVAPTERLVVGGLYGYVRNPIYIADAAVIVGQALVLGRLWLLLYAAGFLAVSAAAVRWFEEPMLTRRFGAEYEAYRREVPGWWPRVVRRSRRGNGAGDQKGEREQRGSERQHPLDH